MTEGTGTYKGMAPPLLGEYEQTQQTAATDMVTLTGASSQTGDFLVCQNSSGTEKFCVDVNGAVTAASTITATGGLVMTVYGITTADFAANNVGTRTFAVTGLTSNDVVAISPREATDGVIVVDKVAAGTLQLRNVTSEAAAVEFNYLVFSAA